MSVEYFVHRYPDILSEIDMDQLSEEFLSYQVLPSMPSQNQSRKVLILKITTLIVLMCSGAISRE